LEAPSHVLAVVRRRIAPSEISRTIGDTIVLVYDFLKTAPIASDGHNVVVYRDVEEGLELEVGVQVSGTFEGKDAVQCTRSPGGRAAHTAHYGDYAGLGAAFVAIRQWCKDEGLSLAGPRWEVYGDWDDNPARRRTDLYVLLE
jgi:effector-binding domain-containing protein